MRDFTLLIPTYNRPRELRALLYFLRSTHPGLKLLVADSSEDKGPVREIASENWLVEYPSTTHPFDKFLDVVKGVTTTYCQICADDDLVFVDGLRQCVEALKANPSASCARGKAFSFGVNLEEPDTLRLADGHLVPPAIEQATALERLGALFGAYHATIYSTYRTHHLVSGLGAATKMSTLLGKELLCSALAAVAGPILSVPAMVHGRNLGVPVLPYRAWHPLEFFCNYASEFGREYADYRERLGFALLPDTKMAADEVLRAIDVIHLRYFVQYCPRDVLDFLVERRGQGASPKLPPELQKSLLNAALSSNTVGLSQNEMHAIFDQLGPYMWGLTPHDGAQMAREARGRAGEGAQA